MESVIKQLVKAGYDLAVQLGNQLGMKDTASLVQRLTAQLDITAVALQEMTKKRDAEHGDVLTWEKTMFKVCGEDGHKSVAAKFAELEAKCAELAAEREIVNADNAYLRDQIMCWARECDRITYTHTNKITDAHQSEAEQDLANTFPASSAFLAEVRAQGVEMFGQYHNFSEKLLIQKEAKNFAAQLRQEASQ